LEKFSRYADIDEVVATSNTRSIEQIISNKISLTDVTSIKKEKKEKKEDDTKLIL
jgi:hypothetical protein